MAEEHTKAIETLKAEHAAALEEKQNAIAALEQEKADLQTKVDENATSMEALQTELNGAKESRDEAAHDVLPNDARAAN